MKKNCIVQGFNKYLILIGVFIILFFTSHSYSVQENNVDEIIEQVAVRLANYPRLKNWQVSVLSTTYRMDKNWQPEKKTVVRKTVTVRDKERTEDIINAIEIEIDKDKTKDVTEKFRKDAMKEMRKREERRAKGKPEDEKGRRELSVDEMFPFGVTEREKYIFSRKEDTELAGIPVHVLESRAKIRSDKYYDGTYYINKENYQVIKVEIQPAKNPSVLKLFEMEAYFQIIPGGYFVLNTTRVKIHVGLIIKNIRLDAEEKYSNYVVLDE